MIHPTTVKHFEDGKCVGEFNDLQVYHDFIVALTKRKCDADYILQQRDNNIKRKYFWLGCIIQALFIILVNIVAHYL